MHRVDRISRGKRIGDSIRRLLSGVAAVAIVLTIAEWTLSIRSPVRYHVWQPGLHRVFRPLPEAMPGVDGDGHFRTSADGLRADAMDDSQGYRILAIGGSTTESLYLDDSEVWTRQLQDRLNSVGTSGNVWVGNAGKSGNTTRHHRLQVARLLPQHPGIDAVMVLSGINDFLRMLAADDRWQPMASTEALTPLEYDLLTRQAFSVHPGWDSHYPRWKRSELWRHARRVASTFHGRELGVVQDSAGRYMIRLRQYRRQASGIRDRLPDLTPVIDEFERNLRAIIGDARRHGVRPILITQPTLWHADLDPHLRDLLWAGGVGSYFGGEDAEYYTVEALAEGIARFNERTLRLCRELSVECIDLARTLSRSAEVYYDDMHFNENGSQEVARLLSEHLLGPEAPPLRR